MRQETRQKTAANTFFGLSEQKVTEICQDMFDVQRCLDTNTIIIKNTIKGTKHRKANGIENEISGRKEDTTAKLSGLSALEKLEGFKKIASYMPKSIQSDTAKGFKQVNKNVSKFAKSTIEKSSEIASQGKTTISENAPRAISWMNISLKALQNRKKLHQQQDLDLLKRLAELKQEGILSPKEFTQKKKEILEKIGA